MQLPTPLGWKRPATPISRANIASLAAAISSAPTVTANVGTSPFLHKRTLDDRAAPPQPSYNLELNERDVFPRAKIPIPEIPEYPTPDVTNAKARARKVCGPPPVMPNAYFETLTVGQWEGLGREVSNYTQTFMGVVADTLGEVVGLPPL